MLLNPSSEHVATTTGPSKGSRLNRAAFQFLGGGKLTR